MSSPDFIIETGQGKKGRAFTAASVALVTARGLFDEAQADAIRPLWAAFAGSDATVRPFVANLRIGRKAAPRGMHKPGPADRIEFLKSVGYQVSWQREDEGSVATIYHPELLRLDPGMNDHEHIRFAMLVPTWWLDEQAPTLDPEAAVRHVEQLKGFPVAVVQNIESNMRAINRNTLLELVPTATLMAAYLDRRSRCPIIADARFHTQLFCALLDVGMASLPGNDTRYGTRSPSWGVGKHGFDARGLEHVGVRHAIAFNASREGFESVLAEQTSAYLRVVK